MDSISPAQQIAIALLQARSHGGPASIPTALLENVDYDTALRAQQIVLDTLNRPIAAWKVAVPPGGPVLSAPIHADRCFPHGAQVPLALCGDCGIECEIAFVVGKDFAPRSTAYSADEVSANVQHACITVEILNSRLPAKYESPRNAQLADLLSNAGLVVGKPFAEWRPMDLKNIPVEFSADGKIVVEKNGGHPAGEPFSPVVALVNHLASRGEPLAAGTVVTTGSYTGVHFMPSGGRFRVNFHGFPPLEFTIG